MSNTHEYKLRIRYEEVDGMKIVHNLKYLVYFEEARIDLVEKENYPYEQIEKEGIILPISETMIKFINPIYYGEYIKIFVNVGFIKNFSMKFIYWIFKENGELSCEGYTIHASVEKETLDFIEVPEKLIDILKQYIVE